LVFEIFGGGDRILPLALVLSIYYAISLLPRFTYYVPVEKSQKHLRIDNHLRLSFPQVPHITINILQGIVVFTHTEQFIASFPEKSVPGKGGAVPVA
jgi:hypothetical protein